MFVFGGEACAIQPEVRYFRTSNRIFPGSFVSRPLVKGNEDPGYEGDLTTARVSKRKRSARMLAKTIRHPSYERGKTFYERGIFPLKNDI